MASLLERMLAELGEADLAAGLLGRPPRTIERGMGGCIAATASLDAQLLRHVELEVDHVLWVLLALTDVERALAERGVLAADARAVLEQLLAEKTVVPLDAAGVPLDERVPPRSARVQALLAAASPAGFVSVSALLRELAAPKVLPAELAFLAPSLVAIAPGVGALLDGAMASKDGSLTLRGWSAKAASAVSVAQHLADKRAEAWQMRPLLLYLATLSVMRDAVKARGLEIKAMVEEAGVPVSLGWRAPPRGHVAGLSAGVYAILLRAERYAAAEASDVRLRDLLSALHDEPQFASGIRRLIDARPTP